MTAWYGNGFAGIRNWNARRTARKALHGLDDRMLADIGVARHQIDGTVDHLIRTHAANDNRWTRAA